MCNLYSHTSNIEAIRAPARTFNDLAGNLAPQTGIYSDYPAPIMRTDADGVRELAMARWGMPGPAAATGTPVTNFCNLASRHWQRWTGQAHSCLVPFTSFSDYMPTPNPATKRKDVAWSALDETRPLASFAGLWSTWNGIRGIKANPVIGLHDLFGFLTCEPNAVVKPIHHKAMPVILTTAAERDVWLRAS